MKRFGLLVLLTMLTAGVSAAQAPATVPPAAPTIGASGGIGGGIAIPVGRITDTHAAGYNFMGLIDFSAAEQPYSFRVELLYQHFDVKRLAPAGTRGKNIVSAGASLLARSVQKNASSAYALGGIGVYRATDEGTKPGVNAGLGLEVPLTFFIGIADIRIHWVLSDGKPALSIPITLGARF
jgi:hypothetical protein